MTTIKVSEHDKAWMREEARLIAEEFAAIGQVTFAELPLDGLEAFRLASFGIEYTPKYAALQMDRDCASNSQWQWRSYP